MRMAASVAGGLVATAPRAPQPGGRPAEYGIDVNRTDALTILLAVSGALCLGLTALVAGRKGARDRRERQGAERRRRYAATLVRGGPGHLQAIAHEAAAGGAAQMDLAIAASLVRDGLGPERRDAVARAAQAAGLARCADPAAAALLWACEPSSPLGQAEPGLAARVAALRPGQTLVLDQAYEPLRLAGQPSLDAAALARVWRLITPNKALGLTGVRAAYAIAPLHADAALLARLRALAPSWPLGAHGVALLQGWASAPAHDWLAACRDTLRGWKLRQLEWLSRLGWQIEPSDANFFVAACADPASAEGRLDMQTWLCGLRRHGIKLRDCASFGLPGRVRLAVAPPPVQDALLAALEARR